MTHRLLKSGLLLVMFILTINNACLAQQIGSPPPTPALVALPDSSLVAARVEPGDRLLFIGDDMTQQMFYSRATACALLAVMPEAGLRFYNGGKEGATVEQATGSIKTLLDLSKPTMVFVCLGLNESRGAGGIDTIVPGYHDKLLELIKLLKSSSGVRMVVLLGPPAVGVDAPGLPRNEILAAMSQACVLAAQETGSGYIDLFDHLRAVHREAERIGGEPLTIGGWLPSEAAHVVIASLVLRGLGVTADQLEAIGWAPLHAAEMRRVRGALALSPRSPQLEEAQLSRSLYEAIRAFDERFFRAWRLSTRKGPAYLATDLAAAEEAWANVEKFAHIYQNAQRVAGAE